MPCQFSDILFAETFPSLPEHDDGETLLPAVLFFLNHQKSSKCCIKLMAVATKKKLVRPKYEESEKKGDGKSCEAR